MHLHVFNNLFKSSARVQRFDFDPTGQFSKLSSMMGNIFFSSIF